MAANAPRNSRGNGGNWAGKKRWNPGYENSGSHKCLRCDLPQRIDGIADTGIIGKGSAPTLNPATEAFWSEAMLESASRRGGQNAEELALGEGKVWKESAQRFGGGPGAFLCDGPWSMPHLNGSRGLEGRRHCDTPLV